MRKSIALTMLALALFAGACKKNEAPAPSSEAPPPVQEATPVPAATAEPLAVSAVTLGTAISADKKVVAAVDTFATTDKTIYASIDTTGQGHVKLRGVWSYVKGDKTSKVNETAMEFDAVGPASNEFHIDNTKPWPVGDYKVEVFMGDDATPVAVKAFRVQ
jgi:osmotically-inducible protein OsmY